MKYFTERELGIMDSDYSIKQNMFALVDNVLDPLREMINSPIRVTSGYRTPEHNKNIGGSKNSQHTKGQAVDIQPMKVNTKEVFETLINNFEFDQAILEDNGHTQWIHISYSSNNRKQKLKAIMFKGKMIYSHY